MEDSEVWRRRRSRSWEGEKFGGSGWLVVEVEAEGKGEGENLRVELGEKGKGNEKERGVGFEW